MDRPHAIGGSTEQRYMQQNLMIFPYFVNNINKTRDSKFKKKTIKLALLVSNDAF